MIGVDFLLNKPNNMEAGVYVLLATIDHGHNTCGIPWLPNAGCHSGKVLRRQHEVRKHPRFSHLSCTMEFYICAISPDESYFAQNIELTEIGIGIIGFSFHLDNKERKCQQNHSCNNDTQHEVPP